KYGPKFTEEQMWEEGKDEVRRRYRRRSVSEVRDEIDDEVKEHFGEHQLKVELIQIMEDELNDLSGANKPVEVKLFGPDHGELRHLAKEVAEVMEKQGKGRGLKEVDSHVMEGNPDLMIEVDGVWSARGLTAQEVERQLQTIYLGQIATQVRESSARITDVRVRYPDAVRFGRGFFDPQSLLNQWILLPPALAPSTPTTSLSGGLL